MLIRELTEKKEPVNEAIFTTAVLTTLAIAAIGHWVASAVFDYMLEGTKNWLNNRAMRNFKPTGADIPHHTEIKVKAKGGRKTLIYNADAPGGGKWVERDTSSKAVKYKTRKTVEKGKPRTRIVYATGMKGSNGAAKLAEAIRSKNIKFLNKRALLEVIQKANIKTPAGTITGPKQFSKTGDSLDVLIAREESGKGARAWQRTKRISKRFFSLKVLTALQFVLPVWAANNVINLHKTYEKRLAAKDDPLNIDPHPESDGKTVYNENSYDRDVRSLRAATTSYVAIYIMSLGGPVLATLALAFLFTFRKNKIEKWKEKVPYAGFYYKVYKFVTKGLKFASVTTGGIVVAGSVNPDIAYGLGKTVSDTLIRTPMQGGAAWESGESAGESLMKAVAKWFDQQGSVDKILRMFGLSNKAEQDVDKQLSGNSGTAATTPSGTAATTPTTTGSRSILSEPIADLFI